jgi:flagellar hook-associated protein 2
MAAFTALGVGSGQDLNTMVTQLVALERAPLKQLQTQAGTLQTQISAFGKVSSLFSALQDASNALTNPTLWNRSTASSSDASKVSASGGAGAAAGNYAVTVQALAGNQTVASQTALSAATAPVGSGTLTIDIGSWNSGQTAFTPGSGNTPLNISVTGSDTLQSLRDKINAAGAGVSASLVSDASGVRLSVRSTSSGADNGFRISADDGSGNAADPAGLGRFAFDPASGSGGLQLKQAASNARATVNGIAVESAVNDISGVVEGLTLTLQQETATPVSISVSADTASVTSAIKGFASAYSALASYLIAQTRYDAASKTGGPLQGDAAVNSLQQRMRSVLGAVSGASSAFPRLSDIGLEVQRDGTLLVNDNKVSSAVANLPELKKAFAANDTGGTGASDGFARRYANLAMQALGVDGAVTAHAAGLQKLVNKNSDDQAKLNDRVDAFQTRLVAQYTALDGNLAKLNALSSYVTQQVANWNKSTA